MVIGQRDLNASFCGIGTENGVLGQFLRWFCPVDSINAAGSDEPVFFVFVLTRRGIESIFE
jgi:hypothetical protein